MGHIRRHRLDLDYALIPIPAALPTLAGLLMAGVDRRPFTPRPRRERVEFPHDIHALPSAPEMGFDATGKALGEAWAAHLENKFAAGLTAFTQIRSAWYDMMRAGFVAAGQRGGAKREVEELASDELAYRADNGEIYYFVVEAGAELEWRPELEQMIADFKRRYPAVVFLQLKQDRKVVREESAAFRVYRDMLPLAGEPEGAA